MQNAESPNVAADSYARPALHERTRYTPNIPQEEFIVPLLKREIEGCVQRFAAPARGGKRAVDIGCGGQPFRQLLEESGYSYCGVDVNPDGGPKVDVVCAADDSVPVELAKRGPFDFLLCTEVLEHVANWQAAFANFNQLLAPGGRALLTAPFFYQLHEEPYDFWRPTPHAIEHYARVAGLNVLYRRGAGDAWDVMGTLLGTCQFAASSARLVDRMAAKVVRVSSRLIFRAVLQHRLQSRVKVEAPLFLSNVAVLEKSADWPEMDISCG